MLRLFAFQQERVLRFLVLFLVGMTAACTEQSSPSPSVDNQEATTSRKKTTLRPSRPDRPTGRSRPTKKKEKRTLPRPGEGADSLGVDPGLDGMSLNEPTEADEIPVSDFHFSQMPRPQLDEQQLANDGIRLIESRHLALYTDLPTSDEVDRLPAIFDLAVPGWCRYFDIDPDRVSSWKMIGYLIHDRALFRRVKLLTADLPAFKNGFQRGGELWVYEQKSDYYQRHLLLHEGTHAFMFWYLRGAGPPWYMEGMAELLGTHRWTPGSLQLGYFPQSADEVELWGRTRIVQNDVAAGNAMSLQQIMEYGPTAHIANAPYGWCWAAAAFLEGHPEFKDRFRQLRAHVRDDPRVFRQVFDKLFRPDLDRLTEQWELFVANLEYGYDLKYEAIDYREPIALPDDGADFELRADRGWQSTGIRIEAGREYSLVASGRYQVARLPQEWWCEPGGITIKYYRGRPLGVLLAAVVPTPSDSDGPTPLLQPRTIGLEGVISSEEPGILFLRINESPSGWADNSGKLTVTIKPKT